MKTIDDYDSAVSYVKHFGLNTKWIPQCEKRALAAIYASKIIRASGQGFGWRPFPVHYRRNAHIFEVYDPQKNEVTFVPLRKVA